MSEGVGVYNLIKIFIFDKHLKYTYSLFCRTLNSSSDQILSPKPKASHRHRSAFIRNKRKQRKKGKSKLRKSFSSFPRTGRLKIPSAASSPGRATPSPDSLVRICTYWENRLNSPEYIIHSDSE